MLLSRVKDSARINQAAPGGEPQDAERSRDFEALLDCGLRPFPFIDQDEIGMDRQGERVGGPLPCSQRPKRGVVPNVDAGHLNPRRKISRPVANEGRSRGMPEFLMHGVGYEHGADQPRKECRCDRWKAGRRAGWYQPQPGASEAQAFKASAFALGVLTGIFDPDIVSFQEFIELETRFDFE